MRQREGMGHCLEKMLVWRRVLIKVGVNWVGLWLFEGSLNRGKMAKQSLVE